MTTARTRPRGWVWLQLAAAWVPMWALFAVLITLVHGTPLHYGALRALGMIVPGALLGLAVYRLTDALPWPHPFRLRFVAAHVVAAPVYAVAWWLLVSLIDTLVARRISISTGPGLALFIMTGLWLYLVVAGVAYANRATERAARLEAQATRAQLEALRTQLHPHFLFNALHTVVQLIPLDPRGAARAAELLAAVLRTTIEERRDIVSLAEEWAFVQRYLAIEAIRFGDRLVVETALSDAAGAARLPSFALQTLVENAVRHGAAPRTQPTRITIDANVADDMLELRVCDDGAGAQSADGGAVAGTGLRRLRERMGWLYGGAATLKIATTPGAGFAATLRIPQSGDAGRDETQTISRE